MTYKYNPRTEEPSYTTALKELRPKLADNNIEYHIDGKGNILYWGNYEEEPPTCEEVNQEYQRQLKEFAEQSFYRMRKQSLPDPYDLLLMLHEDIKSGNVNEGSFVSVIDEVMKKFPKIK